MGFLRRASEPLLPIELERDIFEMVARTHRLRKSFSSMSKLLLIAKRVKNWIEPIIYDSITLDTSKSWTLLERTILSRPSIARKLIHSLCITPYLSTNSPSYYNTATATLLTQLCYTAGADVHSIALWSSSVSHALMGEIISSPPKRLSFAQAEIGEIFFYECKCTLTLRGGQLRNALDSITHLDLGVLGPTNVYVLDTHWLRFTPQLTHLAFQAWSEQLSPDGEDTDDDIDGVADFVIGMLEHPLLEVLVAMNAYCPAHVVGRRSMEKLTTIRMYLEERDIDDDRIVIMDPPKDWVCDWEAHRIGEMDMWARAEEALASGSVVDA